VSRSTLGNLTAPSILPRSTEIRGSRSGFVPPFSRRIRSLRIRQKLNAFPAHFPPYLLVPHQMYFLPRLPSNKFASRTCRRPLPFETSRSFFFSVYQSRNVPSHAGPVGKTLWGMILWSFTTPPYFAASPDSFSQVSFHTAFFKASGAATPISPDTLPANSA